MALSQAFLDELRSRTTLSALIGESVKLTKAGREHKGCCPFHNEKTASFTVSDDKQFYHCFGCGAHGDAIRWLTDHEALPFMDAVHQLAEMASMEVPARSPEAAKRAARIDELRPALEAAQGVYRKSLKQYENVDALNSLIKRGVELDTIDQFEIGYAPVARGHLSSLGLTRGVALQSGLAWRNEDGSRYGERFRGRIMIPVHDARGRLIGFGGRQFMDYAAGPAKYKNSPDSEIFDKGRVLYNLHRAAPLARAKAGTPGRLIVVEGYFDVIAMSGAGFGETVAPMGTALTIDQIQLLWRVHVSPILLFDGDNAGEKAAARACEVALPEVGPHGTFQVAQMPDDIDPDDLLRSEGADAIDAILDMAVSLSEYLFDAVITEMEAHTPSPWPPEAVAAIWSRLDGMAATIKDEETRAQYLAMWRSRFDREVSAVQSIAKERQVQSYVWSDDGDYAWPDGVSESEKKLILIVQRKLELREERREISKTDRDLTAMAKMIGFDGPTLTRICTDIEADPDSRKEKEALYALYRNVLGIKGPMDEALLQHISRLDGAIEGKSSVKETAPMAIGSASNRLAWADIND